MCGIAGIVSTQADPSILNRIQEMISIVAHRGPDDEGVLMFSCDGSVCDQANTTEQAESNCVAALAHKRLSIIDLSQAGHQPMSNSDGRYWIVFNGEIYNFESLRQELKSFGYEFRSKTDSEVILIAYLHWGVDCLERFNGMWAFGIYDRLERTLFCARDRFGIKPFYYVIENNCFLFASEIKQLIASRKRSTEINYDRLADLLIWGLETHTDETFFKDVQSLPGSHYLLLHQDDLISGSCKVVSFWTPRSLLHLNQSQSIEAFRELLFDSVRLRLRSDVPVGATLSGGLDSSSIVCLAGIHRATRDGEAFSTFNVEFDGSAYSERLFAEEVSKKSGAQMIVLRPNYKDLANDWAKFVWHMEEPFCGLSYFSNFLINRLIRERGITVVLSGQGGDELLLGYERYRTYDSIFKLKEHRLSAGISEIFNARRNANMTLFKQFGYGLYFSWPWLRIKRRKNLVRTILHKDFYNHYQVRTEYLRNSMGHANRYDLQMSELRHYQLPHLLRHDDRVSMAHSVETRLPFLDYRLLELILGQPTDVLFQKGWSKFILRQAMRNILPESVRLRTDKMGYETPTGDLIRSNKGIFIDLLSRHRDDPVVNTRALESRFCSSELDQRTLCSALSYLSWKETFDLS